MKKKVMPNLILALIALLGAITAPLGVICKLNSVEFGFHIVPKLIPHLTMIFFIIATLSWIVFFNSEENENKKTVIRALLINCVSVIVTAIIVYLLFADSNIKNFAIMQTFISVALVSVGLIMGYFASQFHKKTYIKYSQDTIKKIDLFHYVYFVMFSAFLLLLVFVVEIFKGVKEHPLNSNAINTLYQVSTTLILFLIIALSIVLPVLSTLIIKSNKRLNNTYSIIPAISLLIGILLQYILYKDFSLWIMLFVSPAIITTIFNKLIIDESKNNL